MSTNDKINNSRKNFEKLGTVYSKNENVTISKVNIEDINCYWFNSEKSANSKKLIVYLHGGCFVLGSILSHQALVSHVSENHSGIGVPSGKRFAVLFREHEI